MTAVLLRLRTELRSRWRTWVSLTLILGLFGGAVIAIAAGARRTDSAYARFLPWRHAPHGDVPRLTGPGGGGGLLLVTLMVVQAPPHGPDSGHPGTYPATAHVTP